ncbi:GDP-mannose-dependent alpha-(1-6)-phosphatidylinositol monomannoside mannosyltransferase [Methylobrevis pamukkalensis]|uniref:GDP-mannose-dependent alpha-(1-6)-phosphatidylinositol monomannoside mannosyltransferase n=1 Tax=Methylobrevis pamukkalensis TaxID=1439726 RepID=A0A1E3H1J6_9HYPH|nr:GDP-mannose-dependent alpha-(1-6)-phosphatidylinositol monomannoside mannosyltransferase [Methylobrevis pamukkalensis]
MPDAGDSARSYPVHRISGFKPLRRWLKARAVARRLSRGDVDVIFCDSWKSLERLRPGAVPVACLAHGTEFPPAPSSRKSRRIKRSLFKAGRVLASSHFTAGLLEPYVAKERITVVTPPIDPQPIPSVHAIDGLRQRIGEGEVIATLCRLEPRKGVDRLISALPALLATYPALKLAVGGSGADRTRLKTLAGTLGVADSVAFLGRLSDDEKSALFQEATIFAMPSRREGASVEGFGIVYMEAAWFGTPSLAGLDGGAGDAVQDGVTGRLCDGADQASVTAALLSMLGNPERLAQMGEAARRRASGEIWDRKVADYLGGIVGG